MSADIFDITFADGYVTPGRRQNKWDATVSPTADDDADDGYEVGSVWVDALAGRAWVCLDASVAVWLELGAGPVAPVIAGEEIITDGATTVFTLRQQAEPLSIAAYDPSGARVAITQSATELDIITFSAAPAAGTSLVDYTPVTD